MIEPPSTVPPSCRNCGAAASGTYCPNCGQETSLALPTVRAFLRDAAGRYVALDGRLWRTMAALLFRPGYLAQEYFRGRRRRYIRPARLFLVLSIALFALLRFTSGPTVFEDELSKGNPADIAEDATDREGGSGMKLDRDLNMKMDFGVGSWFEPVERRVELFNRLSRREKGEELFAGVLRYGPYAMFALLPLFALLLKLFYLGRARRYPMRPRRYTAHLLFGAYSHSFIFIVVALLALLPGGFLRTAIAVWAIIYLLLSMKRVYGGRWSGVFSRAFVIFIAYSTFFGIAVAGLVVAAILLR
jgi:uncharacterized protein DUF3667